VNKGTLRQILLITDGCSNSGRSPIESAQEALEYGITVNVIGVLDDYQSETDDAFKEIEKIARAGGGIHEVVYKKDLSQTVQAVTRQAMTQTIQGFINKELTEIFGKTQTLVEVDPEKREEVMEVVEELGEKGRLEIAILVDTSASMNDKLMTVKEALIDLSINLHARVGDNLFSVHQFPKHRASIGLIQDWTHQLDAVSVIFPKLVSGGMTPTGSAIQAAIQAWERLQGERYAKEG
jgi:Ca-activated chloride channel family protein